MRKVLIAFIFIVSLILLVYKILTFQVKSIDCISQFYRCDELVLKDIESVNKDNIIKVEKNINNKMSSNPIVKNFVLRLKMDGRLSVRIQERVARYCVRVNDTSYYADIKGMVIKSDSQLKTECVNNSKSVYNLKDNLTKEDLFSQRIYYKLRNIGNLGLTYFENGYFVIEYNGTVKLQFPLEGDEELLAGKVYYTVSQFARIEENIKKNGGTEVLELDFRYNNPVVRYI